MSELDTLLLTPEVRASLARIRSYARVALEDLNLLGGAMPDEVRDTIGSAFLTAQGEISGLLNDQDDGA